MGSAKRPRIEANRSFNLFTSLWIVPLVTLLVAAWLIYQHYQKLGPEIRIDFPSSNGLIAGESLVKYRDVIVGHVTRIGLQQHGKGVQVYVRMDKETEPFLNESSHFWIVSPQVDYRGVRGLETLFKGTYIAMSAERSDTSRTVFTGQMQPYRSPGSGFILHLRAQRIGNIHEGAPVNYRHMRVGNIDKITLDTHSSQTDIRLFIEKKYADLINTTTKFWHQDLMSISMERGELALDLAPLNSVLLGSVSFETAFDRPYPFPSADHVYTLYSRRADAMKQHIGTHRPHEEHFHFLFTGDISGLHHGIPIRYQGFDVGMVQKVNFTYRHQKHAVEADVYGTVDTANFADREHNGTVNLAADVRRGLRAYLRGSNVFFDGLYLDLAYPQAEENLTAVRMVRRGDFWDFPTRPRKADTILRDLSRLLAQLSDAAVASKKMMANINDLTGKESFKRLSDKLEESLNTINSTLGEKSKLSRAIDDLRKTLKASKKMLHGYSSGSLFGKKLEAMIREVGRTSEETKRLMEKLNKKPNALIFGD